MGNTIFYEVEPHLAFNFSGRVQRASVFLRGIAITTSVYCPLAYLKNTCSNFKKSSVQLPVVVSRSSSDNNAVCYVYSWFCWYFTHVHKHMCIMCISLYRSNVTTVSVSSNNARNSTMSIAVHGSRLFQCSNRSPQQGELGEVCSYPCLPCLSRKCRRFLWIYKLCIFQSLCDH